MLGSESHPLMQLWTDGPTVGGLSLPGAYVGDAGRPHSRVTVEPGFWLNLTQGSLGNYPIEKLPIRWWRNMNSPLPNMAQEVEVPSIQSVDISRSLDQDAASCTIVMYDQAMNPISSAGPVAYGPGATPSVESPQWLGQPGYYSPTYMQSAAAQKRWGSQSNNWSQVLTPNCLLRTYQGYGGYTHGLPDPLSTAVANKNLVLTGTWLVDEVSISTDGTLTMKCRDMAKLLIDQMIYPPFIPRGLYPLHYQAFNYATFDNPVPYGPTATPPYSKWITKALDTLAADGYWLVGSDGGVFSFGSAPFYGSLGGKVSGTYDFSAAGTQDIVICDIMRTKGGNGYYLVSNAGVVYTYGDGSTALSSSSNTVVNAETLAYPITAGASQPNQDGYWLLSTEGGVFAFGSALYHGGGPNRGSVQYVDIEPTHTGNGYWLVDANGEIYTFGDAQYYGGNPSFVNGDSVTGMSATADGKGYVLTSAQGGVFCQPSGTKVLKLQRNKCGSVSGYVGGCRCDECRSALRLYKYERKLGLPRSPDVDRFDYVLEEIENILPGDKVVSYENEKRRLRMSGSEVTGVIRREYSGSLVTVTTESGEWSSYTPEHACVAIVKEGLADKHVVYLMRRGNQFRVGVTLGAKRGARYVNGLSFRCQGEGADAIWVLSVHDNRSEALLEEALVACRYGIPDRVFVNKKTTSDSLDLDLFWQKIGANPRQAERCLRDFDRDIRFPLWERGCGDVNSGDVNNRWIDCPVIVRACNLLDGMQVLPYKNRKRYQRNWLLPSTSSEAIVVRRDWYEGPVFSLEVEDDHTYIADGLVTHNCFGDAQFYGSIPLLQEEGMLDGGQLSALITDILYDQAGYRQIGLDGGVFDYGDALFYGSLAGVFTLTEKGNMGYPGPTNAPDYVAIIRDILLWAGFYAYPNLNTDSSPAVYGALEPSGAYPVNSILGGLDPAGQVADDILNKMPPINAITTIKEIVGYIFKVNEDGSAQFSAPNIYAPGNFLETTEEQISFIPVVDESLHITQYTASIMDQDIRSEIVIGSFEPLGANGGAPAPGTVATSYVPKHNLSYLRGMVKPAEWIDQFFIDMAQQQIMAELIALMIWQKLRQGSLTCLANPLLQLDDQVQIMERQSGETYVHYINSIHTNHNLDDGSYLMDITTNWLGDSSSWSINTPGEFTLWSKTVVPDTAGVPISPPSSPSVVVKGAPGKLNKWYGVTATTPNGGETTLGPVTIITTSSDAPSQINYNAISWGASDGATGYNLYRSKDGKTYHQIAQTTTGLTFNDTGVPENGTISPPTTNTATPLLAPGSHTITCYANNLLGGSPTISGTNFSISVGSVLLVDNTNSHEIVTVTAINPGAGTFTAEFAFAHGFSVTPDSLPVDSGIYPIMGIMNNTDQTVFMP